MVKPELKDIQEKLDDEITSTKQDIRTDRMDMSFGEILNMYEDGEIIIDPEYQRAFRWDKDRQTKFIESLLLGIPIPPIFVAENNDNVWELVDGLQRLSTILSFFGILKDNKKNNLVLEKGSIIKSLEEFTVDTIPLKYKLMIKRAVCRVEVIRLDSGFNMRYELFKRLNTGGVELSEQEIRNCIFRGYNNEFNAFINTLGTIKDFEDIIDIDDAEKEKMYYQELVLRFYTLRNAGYKFEGKIQEHMDEYMLYISQNPDKFDFKTEEKLFMRIISLIKKCDRNIFRLNPLSFSTSMYDSIMLCFAKYIDYLEKLSSEEIIRIIDELVSDPDFRRNTGSASSSKNRISAKIKVAESVFAPKEK